MKHLKAIENTQLIAVCSIYNLFRIQRLTCERNHDGSYIYRAVLYRDYRTIRVTWLSAVERKDLSYGVLVRAEWLTQQVFLEGTNIISNITSVRKLASGESLDATVIPAWMLDGFAVDAFFKRIAMLPDDYSQLINQVLSHQYVLYHFIKCPWSLMGDFNHLGGNLERTLMQLSFIVSDHASERLMRPIEELMTACMLLGIAHHKQFQYDQHSFSYFKWGGPTKFDARKVAIDLVHQARKAQEMKKLLWMDRLIDVIQNVEFGY